MKPVTGYYFVIQYCPDLSRQEGANVGVVLFCADPFYLKARTAKGNDRIRRFFRPIDPDWEQINLIKYSIEQRLTLNRDQFRDLASLERFAASRANSMRLTAPRSIAVEDPDKELNRLFNRLVGGRQRKSATRVRNRLDRYFDEVDVAPFIHRDLNVPLRGFQRTLRVPYGFQNGRLNLIQPAAFRDLSPGGVIQKAGRYAFEGDLLYRHPDSTLGELKLVVVGEFSSAQQESADAVEEVLGDTKTELYTTQTIDRLLHLIRTTGKPVTGKAVN